MQSTEIKLGQCQRCSSYVWMADVNGFRTVVDPLPLQDQAHVMMILGAGRQIFEAVGTVTGRPAKLRWLGGPGTLWEPAGRTLVASHPCGVGPALAVEIPAEGPQRAPVQPGRPSDGFPHRPARESGSQGRTAARKTEASSGRLPSPVGHVIRPRSDRPIKCETCGKLISRQTEPYVAIEHYRYVWAMHDYDCTRPDEWDQEAFDRYWDAIRLVGYDTANMLKSNKKLRPIETIESDLL